MKQKIYLLILTLMLCVGQDAWSAVTGTYNSSTKTLSFTGTGEVEWSDVEKVSGYKKATTVTFGNEITRIGSNAFYGWSSLKTVEIPATVTSIGDKAFYNCSNLSLVDFLEGTSNLEVGSYAFTGTHNSSVQLKFVCSRPFTYVRPSINIVNSDLYDMVGRYGIFSGVTDLAEVVIGSNVITIPAQSFEDSGLKKLTFSNATDLRTIGTSAFYETKLTEVIIPNCVETIGGGAFYGCSDLTSITIPNSVTSIGDLAFYKCSSLQSVSIPANVTSIGKSAFFGCSSLNSIKIPANVTSIGEYAFNGCSNLSLIEFSSGKTELKVGSYAFAGTHDSSIPLKFDCSRPFTYDATSANPYGYAEAGGRGIFSGVTALAEVVIGSNVVTIPDNSFRSSGLKNLSFSNATSLKTIGSSAFYGTNLTKVSIPTGVETIGVSAFESNKNLEYVTLPSSLKNINSNTFSGCSSIYSIAIPGNVTSIGANAFSYCSSLRSIKIPSNVTKIGEFAFYDCSSFSLIEFSSGTSELTVGFGAFSGTNASSISLKFICSRPFIYNVRAAENPPKTGVSGIFSTMSALNEVVIGPNVVTIPDKSFYASGVKNLSFSNATSLKTIGSEAFYNTKITEVVVPMGVTDIMSGAFRNCISLKKACLYSRPTVASNAFSSWTELDYGENLTYNTWLAMYGSEKSNITDLLIPNDNISARSQYTSKDNLNTQFPNLKNVVFSDKVTTIGDNIFAVQSGKTNNLETVVFEGEPVAVGSCSFSRCSKLTTIEGKVKSVSNSSFQGCSSLRAVELTDDTELECAFADCTSLQSIVLPNNLKTIAAWDFQNCTALTSITIPSSVTSVNKYSFWNCTNLKTVTINSASIANPSTAYTESSNLTTLFPNATEFKFGEGVSAIGKNALYGCARMTSLELPVSLTAVNDYAFYGCTGLTSVTLPKNLTNMSASAFSGCTSVKSLTIASNTIARKNWTSSSNMNTIFPNLKKVVFGENVKAIGEYAFSVPSDKTNNIETIVFEGNPVDVGSSAFRYNTKLAKIGKVKSVGASSFSNCSSLESIEITGDDVVDGNAFAACSSLKSVTLPNTLTTINQYAFNGCTELTSIEIPSNVTSINVEAFRNCTNLSNLKVSSNTIASKNWTSSSNMNTIFPNLQKVVFGKDVKALGANIFYMPDKSNNIETVVFEGNPVDVGKYAFYYNTKLAKIFGIVKSVSDHSFACCSGLESVSISDDATIERNAFEFCHSLKLVSLPTTLTTIEQYAFNKCTSLTSIEIPSDVTSIDVNAFNGATNLSEVRISSDSMVNPSTPYDATYNLGKIFPYATKVELNLFAWNPVIGDYAFYGATALKSVIAGSVLQRISEIGANAFKGCTNLVLGDDPKFKNTWGYVKTIGESAFEGCTSLKLDELPTNVTTINAATFKGCTGLTSLILPEKLESMALDAFDGCTSLTDVTILSNAFAGKAWAVEDNIRTRFPYATDFTFGEKVTSIGDYAFAAYPNDNSNVKRVTFTSIPSIGEYAFCNGKNIESVTGSIKSVSQYSFAICRKLPSITITDDDVIEEWAFGQCSALKSVTLPDNLKELQYAAFLSCSSLAEIQLPSTVEKFQRAVFKGCTSLKEITLPATVSTFNAQVFMNCSNLAKVTVLNPTPVALTESMDVFNGISATAELNVPGSSLNAYKTAEVWKNFYSYFASDGIKLVDGEPYTRTVSEVVPMVRYTRTFAEKYAGNLQCFYVPFDVEVTDELLKDFTFYKLYMVSQKDENNNGEIESDEPLVMMLSKVYSGKILRANTPYYVRPKAASTLNVTAYNTTLRAAENGSITCSTMEQEYTLTGIYETTNINGFYTMSAKGNFSHYTKDTNLGSFRWYMEIKNRSDVDGDMANYARPIEFYIDGEDETTGVVALQNKISAPENSKVYTLDGRQVTDIDNLSSGIYIINGKKVVKK